MEPWLDESFASYTELVYGQYIGYDSGYSRRYMNLVDMADDMKREGSAPINRPYYDFSSDDPYINAAYFYGQVCLYQMQEIIGQEAMYGVIREYVRRNAFHNATAKDFFDVLYECCGKDNKDLNDLIAVVFDMDRVYN
jgi:aminopeptidase N